MNSHTDFIVPIFRYVDDKLLLTGTGFIVDDLLISTATTFNDKGKYSFRFQNNYYPLNKLRIREFYGDEVSLLEYLGEPVHKNLQIFEVGDMSSSLILSSSVDINDKVKLENCYTLHKIINEPAEGNPLSYTNMGRPSFDWGYGVWNVHRCI